MIRLNGQEVLIPSQQAVQYSLANPHLMYDSIPSSQAQIPTIPAARQNRGVFDYYDEPQSGSYLPELVYQHFQNGDLIKEGYFLLTEASLEEGYKGVFSDKLGLFFGEYQMRSLREIDFGTVTPPAALPALGAVSVGGQLAYCYPTVINDFFYGSNGPAVNYSGRLNAYAAGSYTGGAAGVNPRVPMFFANWILRRIAEITGVTITGNFLTHPVWSSLILFNVREAETATVNVAEHLPAMTVVEFILELRKIANLKFDFNSVERTLEIGFWEDSLAAPTERDWTNKAVAGEFKTPEANTRVQISMQLDGSDAMVKDKPAFFADYLSEQTPGARNGIAQILMKFSSVLTDPATGLLICKQEGQTSRFGQETKTFAPRLAFWRGIVGGMPVASATSGALTLNPTTLAATCWKETIALRKRMFYLQKKFIINEADLAKLDFAKKYHSQGVDYLLAMVNISVPIKDVADCLMVGGV